MANVVLSILKLVLAILLIPVVWVTVIESHGYVMSFPGAYSEFFLWGGFVFLMCYLFFYQFWGVYEFGQKIIAGLFVFLTPINGFVAKLIPCYLTAVMLAFYVTNHFLGITSYDHYFMFFSGFTLTMHLILCAQDLQDHEKLLIKPAYLFSMMVVFTAVALVTVLLFNLAFNKFIISDFVYTIAVKAGEIYYLPLEKWL